MSAAQPERHRRAPACRWRLVDELARGLQAAAEEGVGGAAHEQVFLSREREHARALGGLEREGFLAVRMLAGAQDALVHGGVRLRDGEVDDQVEVVVRQERVDGQRADAMLGRLGLGAGGVEVGAGDDFENGVVVTDPFMPSFSDYEAISYC